MTRSDHFRDGKTQSLRTKLILLCVSSITVALTALGTYQYASQKKQLNAALAITVESAISRLSVNLATPVWNLDKDQAGGQMIIEMSNPDLAAVAVRMEGGALFIAATNKDGKSTLVQADSALPPKNELFKAFEIKR